MKKWLALAALLLPLFLAGCSHPHPDVYKRQEQLNSFDGFVLRAEFLALGHQAVASVFRLTPSCASFSSSINSASLGNSVAAVCNKSKAWA